MTTSFYSSSESYCWVCKGFTGKRRGYWRITNAVVCRPYRYLCLLKSGHQVCIHPTEWHTGNGFLISLGLMFQNVAYDSTFQQHLCSFGVADESDEYCILYWKVCSNDPCNVVCSSFLIADAILHPIHLLVVEDWLSLVNELETVAKICTMQILWWQSIMVSSVIYIESTLLKK